MTLSAYYINGEVSNHTQLSISALRDASSSLEVSELIHHLDLHIYSK